MLLSNFFRKNLSEASLSKNIIKVLVQPFMGKGGANYAYVLPSSFQTLPEKHDFVLSHSYCILHYIWCIILLCNPNFAHRYNHRKYRFYDTPNI